MATKDEIIDFAESITKHRLWPEFTEHMKKKYFQEWTAAEELADREKIYFEHQAFRRLTGRLGVYGSLRDEQEQK